MRVTIELSEHEARFVDSEVESGRYATRDEVLSGGLLLLENLLAEPAAFEGDDLDRLRAAWREGLANENVREIDFEELKREGRRRLAART